MSDIHAQTPSRERLLPLRRKREQVAAWRESFAKWFALKRAELLVVATGIEEGARQDVGGGYVAECRQHL